MFNKLFAKFKKANLITSGDIISQRREDGSWHVVKILAVDEMPDNSATAHCLTYQPSAQKPTVGDMQNLQIYLPHSPVDVVEFSNGWQVIGNTPSTVAELSGFTEYLKHSDFQRYAEVVNQKVDDLVAEANRNFQLGQAARQEHQYTEAIEFYTIAFDQYPSFIEAIDNRAFVHMDMGQYSNAIRDFQRSLQLNPNGVTAFFAMGECLMKLEQYEEARLVFEAGLTKFPEKKDLFLEFYNKAAEFQQQGRPVT